MNILSTRLVTPTSVLANGLIPVGAVTHKRGCGMNAYGTTWKVESADYHVIQANVKLAPTATGTVTVTMYDNGQPIASASDVIGTANNQTTLPLLAVLYSKCGCASHTITIDVDVASSVNELDVVIEGR